MDMCIKCGVRPAVMYITKMENGKTSMEGYCLSCAKELGLAPVDQMFEKFGISADDIDSMNEQMNEIIESMGGPEALQEAEGIVSVKEISDPYSNIQISFKPSMLEKSISNIILEKCDVKSEITESKLRQ